MNNAARYAGKAVNYTGSGTVVVATVTGNSVGALATELDKLAPDACRYEIRDDHLSCGIFTGAGNGRVMASKEGIIIDGEWRKEWYFERY